MNADHFFWVENSQFQMVKREKINQSFRTKPLFPHPMHSLSPSTPSFSLLISRSLPLAGFVLTQWRPTSRRIIVAPAPLSRLTVFWELDGFSPFVHHYFNCLSCDSFLKFKITTNIKIMAQINIFVYAFWTWQKKKLKKMKRFVLHLWCTRLHLCIVFQNHLRLTPFKTKSLHVWGAQMGD